jgi:uncharacterized repeat protein (TIGR03803 family)
MRISGWSSLIRGVVAATVVSWGLAVSAQAQAFATLASFNGTAQYFPLGSLIQAPDGTFYGTTWWGGNGYGTVFRITPAGQVTRLYSFCSVASCDDGTGPVALILGSDGDLYGVTWGGGSTGVGTVFRMTIGGKLTTLYSFSAASGGGLYPQGLVQASNGNLFGATVDGDTGGPYGSGALFEVTPTGGFRVLYTFCSQEGCTDGANPYSAPIQGSNGNFYGTTYYGGSANYGVLYELTDAGSYKVLYDFCSQADCADGGRPNALVQDSRGNLYGTALAGGANGYGAVFEFSSEKQYTVLHSFGFGDGANPQAGLTLANDGNLYGATSQGSGGGGNIFELTPAGGFTSLYSFCDGTAWPTCTVYGQNALFQGTDGLLYGTTPFGGNNDAGTAFSVNNKLHRLVETVPARGKASTRVIILGNKLRGATRVTFNGLSAAFTVESDTYITATVPEGAKTGTVSVVTPTGTLKSNPQFVVTK